MEKVRCTNCGSTAIIPSESGEFVRCEACGSTFSVSRAAAFSKVELDHTQDVKAWREYLGKQLRLQQDSSKSRDYCGVKLFAQKILSVLPDDFRANYYSALADRYADNDTAFEVFASGASLEGVSPDEVREVASSMVACVEPKYRDMTKDFILRACPDSADALISLIDRNVKSYIQRLRYTSVGERDVFICHRTADLDQDIADEICTRLEARGLRCWIAPRNILAGSQNYERDIMKGVENCRLFLLVSSFKSIYSKDCETELKAAVLADKVFYSYRIDDTPYDGVFDKALAKVQWLDASDDPYAHLEQLVVDVKGILARDEREKAELEELRSAARERERVEAEARRSRESERIDRLERLMADGAAVPHGSVKTKIKRAELEVEAGDFDRARKLVDEALDVDPEDPLAWWLLALCDLHLAGDRAALDSGIDFTSHRYYKNAERCAHLRPDFEARLSELTSALARRTVKTVSSKLDEAEKLFSNDDYDGMNRCLREVAKSFSDEDSIIYRDFPDVASRYFWLGLWAKYGQNYLVCVEDITRESEYKQAMKYASTVQAAQYSRMTATVSKNAEMFLRERSKKRANDSKLVDYLVDNKNILAPEVYRHYSSLMYFRKMLSELNMTEAQLRASSLDISTNEYFMLATSMATEEQQRQYGELTAALDANREEKTRRDGEQRRRSEAAAARERAHKQHMKSAVKLSFYGLMLASYILFAIGAALTGAIGMGRKAPVVLFAISAAMRLASDVLNFKSNSKASILVSLINIMIGIASIAMSFDVYVTGHSLNASASTPVMVLCIICFAFEAVNISRQYRKNRR